MSNTSKHISLCRQAQAIAIETAEMISSGEISFSKDEDLVTALCDVIVEAVASGSSGFTGEQEIHDAIHFTRRMMKRDHGTLPKEKGRVWWDRETEEYVTERVLYGEYLDYHREGETFEEFVKICETESMGTLELITEVK